MIYFKKVIFLATLLVAAAAPGVAHAQSVDTAYVFLDRIFGGGLKVTDGVVDSSQSATCKTTWSGTSQFKKDNWARFSISIDWSRVTRQRHDYASSGIFALYGGLYRRTYHEDYTVQEYTGAQEVVYVESGSVEMERRLEAAIKVIMAACAPKDTGF